MSEMHENAVTISPSEKAVRVGHVDNRAAFNAVVISDVEAMSFLTSNFHRRSWSRRVKQSWSPKTKWYWW